MRSRQSHRFGVALRPTRLAALLAALLVGVAGAGAAGGSAAGAGAAGGAAGGGAAGTPPRPEVRPPIGPDPTLPSVPAPALHELAETRVREAIISDSIRRYGAECACDYQLDHRGRRCGARAGSLSGPRHPKPVCTPSEVSEQQVETWHGRR